MGAVIEVRDSSTLERLSTLKPSDAFLSPACSLSFSPDGRLLACLQQQGEQFPRSLWRRGGWLHVWDIQTGVIIRSIDVSCPGEITFSTNNNRRVVNHIPSYPSSKRQVCTYDLLEDTQPSKAEFPWSDDHQLGAHWTHEYSLRFTTSFKIGGRVMIEIRELQQTSHPPPVVESFSVPHHSGKLSFSPVSVHASFVTKTDVVILDVRDSRILLQIKAAQSPFIPPGHFSPDGHFFVCGTEESRICVWENGSTDYEPWSNLRPRLLFEGLAFSPTTSSILTWGQQGIQVLNPGGRSAFLSSDEAGYHHDRRNHLVAYSVDGALTATTRQKDHVIKILDNLSGSPHRFIDTGMEILDIKIVDNTICMASSCGLVWWDLETGRRARGVQDVIDRTIVIEFTTNHLALSHDCSQIALVIQKTELYLWREGLPPVPVPLHNPKVRTSTSNKPLDIISIRSSPNQRGLWLLASESTRRFTTDELRTWYFPVELEMLGDGSISNVTGKSSTSPWPWVDLFSCGYKIGIGSKEWVVDPEGRKVLWLPPSWRAKDVEDVRWNDNFLAFLHSRHPDPIIIQFCP